MGDIDQICEGKVTHDGFFDFKSLYNFLYEYINEDEGYFIIEKKYVEKLKGDAKDIEIEWECTKKINDYFRIKIKAKFRLFGLASIEVQDSEGNKKKTNKGSFEIKVAGYLERDYENKWDESPIMKFLRSIYDRYIIKTRIDSFEMKVKGDCDDIFAQTKSFLALEGKK